MPIRGSRRVAADTRQAFKIGIVRLGKNLSGGDGISKTETWKNCASKKCAPVWNFANAKTFPLRPGTPNREAGLLFNQD